MSAKILLPFRVLRDRLTAKWLTQGDGEKVGYSLDIIKDAFMQRLLLGHLARFPQQDPNGTPGPSDALTALGNDRRVTRGFDETDANYAERLKQWLTDRKTAGNPFTLMQKLAEYMQYLPKIRVVDNSGNWYTREADNTRSWVQAANWDWDGDTAKWSRFWVIIYPNSFVTEGNTWGEGTWGDGSTWGTSATPEQVATIKFIVNDWKPAGTRCVNIIIAFDPNSFDPTAPEPDGLWGNWSKIVGGVRVPARLSTARYWDGK